MNACTSGSLSCGHLKFRQKKQQKNTSIVAKNANDTKIPWLIFFPFLCKQIRRGRHTPTPPQLLLDYFLLRNTAKLNAIAPIIAAIVAGSGTAAANA